MLRQKTQVVLALFLIAACGVVMVSGQQRAAGPYTADQANAGRTVYQANCAGCHGPDLVGLNYPPHMAGTRFRSE
jgi:mono/diheme cytochrome c family protein